MKGVKGAGRNTKWFESSFIPPAGERWANGEGRIV